MDDFKLVISPDCLPDTIYVVDPKAASTISHHPAVAQAIADGRDPVVVAPNKQIAQEAEEAVRRVGRIDLS